MSVFLLVFVSNLFYASQDVYDAFSADPFRHFWSLAVEEQFYFLYFIILLLGFRLRPVHKLPVSKFVEKSFWLVGTTSLMTLLGTGLFSFASITWLNYFSPIGRLWQLAAGVLLAIHHQRSESKIPVKPTILRFASLSFLAAMFSDLSSPLDWPNVLTLLPTLVTLVFLDAGRVSDISTGSRASRLLVGIGDHSYGIYLLHWPILVFAQRQWGSTTTIRLTAVLLSLLLAYPMKRFIEDVFAYRGTSNSSQHRVFVFSSSALIVVLAVLVGFHELARTGLGLHAGAYYDSDESTWFARSKSGDVDKSVRTYSKSMSLASRMDCRDANEDREVFCVIGGEKSAHALGGIALVGDSQARALSDGFELASQGLSPRLVSWSSGCPFVKSAFPKGREECRRLNEVRLEFLLEKRPAVVVISNLASRYIESDLEIGHGNSTGLKKVKPEAIYVQVLSEVTSELASAGIKVVVVLDIPLPPTYGGLPTLLNSTAASPYVLKETSITSRIVSTFDAGAIASAIQLVNPIDSLCRDGLCIVVKDGHFVYADNDHLSPAGSLLLAESLMRAFQSGN